MLSEQQKKIRKGSKAKVYRTLVAGEMSLISFALFEFATLISKYLPGFPGILLRKLIVSPFFKKGSKSPIVAEGVSVKQPDRISFGASVVVDSGVALDVRGAELIFGSNVYVGKNTIIAAKGGDIVLSDAVNIGSSCRIATQTSLMIGQGTLVGAYSYIGPGDHEHSELDKPIASQGMKLKDGVSIGSNCWLGARVTIVDGVKIGNNVIVGAHSLVKDNVPDNSVVVGCPAKLVKTRLPE